MLCVLHSLLPLLASPTHCGSPSKLSSSSIAHSFPLPPTPFVWTLPPLALLHQILPPKQDLLKEARGNGLVHALRDAWPTTLQAAVVSTTGSELVVVHRRAWLVRGYRPVHSLATTVVPLTRGVRVDATDDLHRPGIRRLRLAPTSVTLLAVRDDGVEDAVARLLGGR